MFLYGAAHSVPARRACAGAGWALLVAAALLTCGVALPEPESAALRCQHDRCEYVGGSINEHEYKVEGKSIIIDHLDGSYLNVKCNGFNVLESSALPRADSELRITSVTLSSCPLPAARSLASTLAALNVTLVSGQRDASGKPLGRLTLEMMPREPPLTRQHFLGLEDLLVLRLAADEDERVTPEPGILGPLRRLEVLNVQRVTLSAGELQRPPPALRSLRLLHAGVQRLPEALHSLTDLRELTVASESALDVVAVPSELLSLELESPATTLQLDAAPALSSLMLTGWVEELPKPLTHCGNLTSLILILPAVRELPDDWLASCSRLETLELQYAKNLTSLPSKLLRNASALTLLSFNYCALVSLPAGLLDYVPRLHDLVVIGNTKLKTLPSGMFAVARDLRILNLSSNDLNIAALAALAPLEQLTTLNLEYNRNIGDLCETNGKSSMSKSTQLTELILRGTRVERICSDWRDDMALLTMLDLRDTSISKLSFDDLQFKRNVNASKVLLDGAPVTVVGMTREQYEDAVRHSRNDASVQLDVRSPLKCDCDMYWTRRALSAPEKPLKHVSGMRCAGVRPLKDVPPEDMLCAVTGASLPPECACSWRPDEDPTQGRVLVRVSCEGRALGYVPRLPTPVDVDKRVYELLLNHNNITELHADILRSDIKRLDLRNNLLTRMNGDTVSKLSRFGGKLQLASNPLECSCSAAPLLRALTRRPTNLIDLESATCEDGRSLNAASQTDCLPLTTWLAGGVAAMFALAVAAVSFLASRERRFFLKAVLHRWGCLWYVADTEEDDGRRYDAFVTFSHKDEPAVIELVARLEPTYRLCVHYRDWIPGHYITEQIVESVQESRRTIALVSRHFLNSGWALAEFRQAHAQAMLEAKPRLVVVLLEDPSTLQLDDQLRRYLATNTYVRWGDPWFWDKLALALPRPRPPHAAPTAAGPRRPPAPVASPLRTAAAPCGVRSPSTLAAAPSTCPAATPASLAPVASPDLTTPTIKRPPPDTKLSILAKASESKLASTNEPALIRLPPAPTRNVTPSVRDEKQSIRNTTPSMRDMTPPVQDVTSVMRSITSVLQDVNLSTRNVTPPVRDVKSSVRDMTLPVRDVLLVVRDVMYDGTPPPAPAPHHMEQLGVAIAT